MILHLHLHLADAFIQSHSNRTRDLGVANVMLYQLSYRKALFLSYIISYFISYLYFQMYLLYFLHIYEYVFIFLFFSQNVVFKMFLYISESLDIYFES